MQLIRGGRKLRRRERRAGGPDRVLNGTVVLNTRYGKPGELRWLAVHHQCVLPGDDFGEPASATGLHVPHNIDTTSVRCDRCGRPFETVPHLTVAQ